MGVAAGWALTLMVIFFLCSFTCPFWNLLHFDSTLVSGVLAVRAIPIVVEIEMFEICEEKHAKWCGR